MIRTRWIHLILLASLMLGCQSPTPSMSEPAAQMIQAKITEDATPMKTPYITGAYYYPWYSPDRHWDEGYRGTPVLGEYDSADPVTINRHIDWATEYSVDFFAISWWGQRSFEDTVMRGPFLDAIAGRDFRFAILYESAGLLNLNQGKINLDDPAVRKQLTTDFTYLAKTTFQHPNALTIGGRPVIFLYLTRTFTGDVKTALQQAKTAAIAAGSAEPYIIGDEVYWQYPNAERIRLFDGVTAYNMHTSVPNIADGFAENVDKQYRLWAKATAQQGIAFIPDILPGFDDTAVRPEAGHPPIPRSVDLFTNQLNTAIELASGEQSIIMVTSWNEWHEDTSIEPALEEGTAYLEVLRYAQTP